MISAYHQPTKLDEALHLVAQGATPVAGATGLYSAKSKPEGALVDLMRLGLGGCEVKPDRIVLGATATLTDLAERFELPGMEGAVLRRGARAVGSRPMRNMITLGGNIAHVAFWEDMPVVLLALDAQLEIQRAGEPPRTMLLHDALQRPKGWDGGLITRIIVPRREGICAFGHERFSRTVNDYALATSCVTLRRDGATAKDVRIVIGALQPRPFRVPDAEAMVEGRPFEPDRIAAAASLLKEKIAVAPNFRASAEYRRGLAETLTRRALEAAFSWAMRE